MRPSVEYSGIGGERYYRPGSICAEFSHLNIAFSDSTVT